MTARGSVRSKQCAVIRLQRREHTDE
jgi:hypothetical protein